MQHRHLIYIEHISIYIYELVVKMNAPPRQWQCLYRVAITLLTLYTLYTLTIYYMESTKQGLHSRAKVKAVQRSIPEIGEGRLKHPHRMVCAPSVLKVKDENLSSG